MSVQMSQSEAAVFAVPAGASATKIVRPGEALPRRYVQDLCGQLHPTVRPLDLGAEFAKFADEAADWAEVTIRTPDSWPAI